MTSGKQIPNIQIILLLPLLFNEKPSPTPISNPYSECEMENTKQTLRLNVWSGPRNISTALMYSFAQRTDTRVVDEPLYGHYLRVSGAEHPGADEIMSNMECDAERVIRKTILGPCDLSILFMKQMAHHLVEINTDFFNHTTNVLLTRDPVDMLPSLVNQLETPTLRDTGYKKQAELLQAFHKLDQYLPVLDSRELLKNPRQVLTVLCEALGIAFDQSMLAWKPRPRPEDGIWAKHWYHNVHKSTGFQPYRPKVEAFPERLRSLLKECKPYYDQLYEQAIKAE